MRFRVFQKRRKGTELIKEKSLINMCKVGLEINSDNPRDIIRFRVYQKGRKGMVLCNEKTFVKHAQNRIRNEL